MKQSIFSLLVFAVFCSCRPEVDPHTTVLKINKLEVSSYQVNRYITRTFHDPDDNESKVEKQAIIEDVVNHYLVVEDALQKQYDTVHDYSRNIKLISDFMMTKPYGYYWEKVIQPQIECRTQVSPEILKKCSQLYYFTVLRTHNEESLIRLNHKLNQFPRGKQVKNLKKLITEYPDISLEHKSAQWPFSEWYWINEDLFEMQVGSFSKVHKNNGQSYLFTLTRKETIGIPENTYENISSELRINEEQQFRAKTIQDMHNKWNPIMHTNAIDSAAMYLSSGNDMFDCPYSLSLLEYTHSNTLHSVTIQELVEVYKYLPLSIRIANKKELLDAVENYLYTQYLIHEARQIGAYENETFKADQLFYRNNLYYYSYLDREINAGISIDTNQIIQYYQEHPDKFWVPKYKKANLFFFNSFAEAMSMWQSISTFYSTNPYSMQIDKRVVPELQSTLLDYTIDMERCVGFPPEETFKIHNLMIGELSVCLPFRGKHALVLVTDTEEKYLLSLPLVFDYIKNLLLTQQAETLLTERIKKLKSTHKLEINQIESCIN